MHGPAKYALMLICSLALCACFMSDKPLIDEQSSTAPIPPGKYSVVSDKPDPDSTMPGLIEVKVEGTKTVFVDPSSPDEPATFVMREVRPSYYAMLEWKSAGKEGDSATYMLAHVADGSVTLFDYSKDCNSLERIAAARGIALARLGVVRVEKDKSANPTDSCFFATFDNLAKAYSALLDAALFTPAQEWHRVD